MTSEDYSDLIDAYNLYLPYTSCLLAGTVILLYDTILTIEAEIEVVWRRRFGIVAFLHLFNRYTQLVAYLSDLVIMFPVSDQTCSSLGLTVSVFTMLPYVAWALFSGFRMYALSGRSVVLSGLVVLLSGMFIVPDMYLIVREQHVNSPPPYGCYQSRAPGNVVVALLWASRASLLLGESIVLLWTLRKTRNQWHSFRRTGSSRTLASVLLENGVICFILPLSLNATTMALTLLGTDVSVQVGQYIVVFRDALTTNLISRFLLELGTLGTRANPDDKPDISEEPQGALTTHFSTMMTDVTFVLPQNEDNSTGLAAQAEREQGRDGDSV